MPWEGHMNAMGTARLEAFTDGVLAIAITIMVLELKVPAGGDLASLAGSIPVLLAYVLSFVNIGHYWNNHHHLMAAAEHVDGRVLWANLFLLFWLSLVPFVIRWHDASGFSEGSTASLWHRARHGIGRLRAPDPRDRRGRGTGLDRGEGDPRQQEGTHQHRALYVAVAFAYVSRFVSVGIYVLVILVWLVPDRRMTQASSIQ